jgi:hypothetical protein
VQSRANEKVADDHAVYGKRCRTSHHGLALQSGVSGTMLINGNTERGERYRGRGSEETSEALRTQYVSQHRESRYRGAPDEEADDVLTHSLSSRVPIAAGPLERILARRHHLQDGWLDGSRKTWPAAKTTESDRCAHMLQGSEMYEYFKRAIPPSGPAAPDH